MSTARISAKAAQVDATLHTPSAKPRRERWLARLREELRFFAGFVAILVAILTFVFGHFKIPSESMQPTLEVGDHIYVSKHPYGYGRHSLPFNLHRLPLGDGRVFGRLPERGDVVVFRHPRSDLVMIKRVVGLPGDRIEMLDGRLALNGAILAREGLDDFRYRDDDGLIQDVRAFREALPGEAGVGHTIWERGDGWPLDSAGPWIVPENRVFLMGDNRDNSVDSRAPDGPGFVPVSHLVGRAELILFSLGRCEAEAGLRCPVERSKRL